MFGKKIKFFYKKFFFEVIFLILLTILIFINTQDTFRIRLLSKVNLQINSQFLKLNKLKEPIVSCMNLKTRKLVIRINSSMPYYQLFYTNFTEKINPGETIENFEDYMKIRNRNLNCIKEELNKNNIKFSNIEISEDIYRENSEVKYFFYLFLAFLFFKSLYCLKKINVR